MRHIAVFTVALAWCASVSPLPAQQDRLPVDGIFPNSSYAVLRFGGLQEAKEAARAIDLLELGRRSLSKAGIADLAALCPGGCDQCFTRLRAELSRAGLSPASLRGLLRRPLAFGVGRPTLHMRGLPSMLLAFDVLGREEDAARVVSSLVSHFERALGPEALQRSTSKFLEHDIHQVRARNGAWLITHAIADGYLMIGTGSGYLEDCIRTIQRGGRSIRANPAYRRGLARLRGQPLFSLFLNTRPLVRALEPFLPYEAQGFGRLLGVEGMDGIFWGSKPGPKASTDVVLVGMPGSEKGLLKALFQKPATGRAAKFCAAESVLFATVTLDPQTFAGSCKVLLEHLPTEVRREVTRGIGRGMRQGGVRLPRLERLLAPFGNEITVAATLPLRQGLLPELSLFLEVKDPERAERLILDELRPLLGFRGGRLRTRPYEGSKIHFYTRPGLPISPAFVIRNRMLIFSLMRTDLERTLARASSGQPTLADTSFRGEFRAASPASGFVHLRIGQVIAPLWRQARPHIHSMIDGALADIAPEGIAYDVIPTSARIAEAVGDINLSWIASRQGWIYQEQNPCGMANLLALACSAFDWCLREAGGPERSIGEALQLQESKRPISKRAPHRGR